MYGYALSNGRSRNTFASASSVADIRDTSDRVTPLAPMASMSSSTFRVETPST
jgi:hypothetical protein